MDMKIFFESVNKAVNEFKELKGPFKIVSHLDSDGIAACSIIVKAFLREGKKFSVSILKQLDSNSLRELSMEDYSDFIFTDLGSGYIKSISEKLKGRNIIILDHHKTDGFKADGVVHVNPRLFGIDGGRYLSGAGVAYFFAKELNEKNKDMAHIAIVGAIGDFQENGGFEGLNKDILDDAVESGKIEVRKGLSIFGMQTKPIHKVLEFSTEPYIPGVTGNESGAINFLSEIGVDFKDKNGKYRKLVNLNDEEMKKLVTGIVLRRLGSEENPEDILGNIYLLSEEEDESPTRDAREFSTLLNSCGRMNKPSLGIGVCLGNNKLKKEAFYLLDKYRQEIISSLNWFYNARKRKEIIEKDKYVIINAEDNVKDTMIGTLTSILSNSNIYGKGKIIVSMVNTLEGDIKVSLRVSRGNGVDLSVVVNNVLKIVGGEGGGHSGAAGCLISQEKQELFLKTIQGFLDKYLMEEAV